MVVRDAFKTFCFADAKTIVTDGVTVVDLSQPAGMDESSFLVSLLGAVCRASLWLAPGSLIRAAQTSGSGAGKGKLARCICAVAYGRQPSAVTAGGSSEELEKRISAALLEGRPGGAARQLQQHHASVGFVGQRADRAAIESASVPDS